MATSKSRFLTPPVLAAAALALMVTASLVVATGQGNTLFAVQGLSVP